MIGIQPSPHSAIRRRLRAVIAPATHTGSRGGAVLLWDFLTRMMQGVTTAFFEDVWSRNFLNVFATPMRITEYLAGLITIGVTNSLVALVAMFALAWAIFGLSFLAYGVAIEIGRAHV